MGAVTVKPIPLDKIIVDPAIQARAGGCDPEVVADYAAAMGRGCEFPAAVVFTENPGDGPYYLAGGFHRVAAARQAGKTAIMAAVHRGTAADAAWLAAGDNQTHGLRRSNADKRLAVEKALRHPEGAGKSDAEIARHTGVSDKTVASVRAALVASSEFPKMQSRTVTRAGVTYTQDTSNIGKGGPPDSQADFARAREAHGIILRCLDRWRLLDKHFDQPVRNPAETLAAIGRLLGVEPAKGWPRRCENT